MTVFGDRVFVEAIQGDLIQYDGVLIRRGAVDKHRA
jgi:hypothetical protein